MENTVVVEFNISTLTYNIQAYPILNNTEVAFIFSFVDDTMPLIFDNLSFGITFKDANNTPVIIRNWPEPGNKYISSDQNMLEYIKLSLMNNTLYKITFWTKHAGINSALDYELQVPKLETYPDYEVV